MSVGYEELEHDSWNPGTPRIRSAGKVILQDIHGVIPFSGERNPITASSTSHKVMLLYRTEANNWLPKVGLAESGAELAVAEEALINSEVFDVEFQPVTFSYEKLGGGTASHTIDLRITFKSGRKRFVFVRNAASLKKPWVQDEIQAILRATPPSEAHEFSVVDADAYSRARRDNLRRIHRLVAFEEADPVADQAVREAIFNMKNLWRVSDLFSEVELPRRRIFQSCLRLIARNEIGANLDAVVCHHSRIWRIPHD